MSFGAAIKKLRQDAGLSQQEVANKLGMARATYASLEVDRREPDLGELKAVADFYEIPLMELVAEEGDDWPGVIHEPVVQYKSHKTPDTLQPATRQQFNPAKLRDVLLYVLAEVGARPKFGESALYQLLYAIDSEYHDQQGKSITGLAYVHNRYGPVPSKAFLDLVKQMQADKELEIVSTQNFTNRQKKYLPAVYTNLENLSATELRHIDDVLARFS